MLHLVVSTLRVGNCASAIPWTHWQTVGDTPPSKKARGAPVVAAAAFVAAAVVAVVFVVAVVEVEVEVVAAAAAPAVAAVAPAPVAELAGPCL